MRLQNIIKRCLATTPIRDSYYNIPDSVLQKVGRNLHRQRNHPLNILKTKIEDHFSTTYKTSNGGPLFAYFDNFVPRVTTQACFDDLLIPPNHVSRAKTDTFYFSTTELLRPHTSAHQTELMRGGHSNFLLFGDCYRRDEIDATHYPVFHQVEGVKVFPDLKPGQDSELVVKDLKRTLESLVDSLFGHVEKKWVDAYFPFTHPSFELEVLYREKWLELLGCGVIHKGVLENCKLGDKTGWAFGIGLERLAMVLFDIPDIRLFWSEDPRFLSQFQEGKITQFQPFSKFPACFKDLSAWWPEEVKYGLFHANDFFSIVREEGGDLVEKVELIDSFTHPKTNRTSHCYRIWYRAIDRNLTNVEVDEIQARVRKRAQSVPGLELR